MIGFYDYTMWATYISLLSSVLGIWFAFGGHPLYAVFCLMFSGFCDMFDGKIARTKKDRTTTQKKYGIELDSLADIVCFGALPSIIGIAWGCKAVWFLPVLLFYVLAALIRLAYFNVTEEERQQTTSEVRKSYLGVPVTSSALVFPLVCCFHELCGKGFPYLYAFFLLLLGVFFIAPVKVAKPGKRGMIAMIAIGLLLFAGLLIFTFVL